MKLKDFQELIHVVRCVVSGVDAEREVAVARQLIGIGNADRQAIAELTGDEAAQEKRVREAYTEGFEAGVDAATIPADIIDLTELGRVIDEGPP